MKIAISADHRGSEASRSVADNLRRQGHEVEVLGDLSGKPSDYPDLAYLVGRSLASGKAERGLLICGSGIGMSIAANKMPGVRAALVHDELTAEVSRSHNDANVLCLSADMLGLRLIEKIVEIWLATPFEGGRHARRVHKIEAIERGKDPTVVKE